MDEPSCRRFSMFESLVNVDWGWLDVNTKVDRSNEWSKTIGVVNFVNEHPDTLVIFCDDMLRVGGAYNELKGQAPAIKTIIPSTTLGLTDEELDELESYLKGEQ